MTHRYAVLLLIVQSICGIARAATPAPGPASQVDPFIGTDRSGNTYPGVQAPFGMVQISPDLKDEGYYYPEPTMHGFALSLMSGPGCPNCGSPFFTVTSGSLQVDEAHYSYTYDHRSESASPGYYRVLMQPFGIDAQLTATTRCGMARFTFPAGKQANLLLPISFANVSTFSSRVDLVGEQMLAGQVSTQAFCGVNGKPIVIYFAMMCDHPFAQHGTWVQDRIAPGTDHVEQTAKGQKVGFYISYPPPAVPLALTVRIGISYVSVNGAINNLKVEMPDNDFDACHARALADWNRELGLIDVSGGTALHARVFYTALYHALLFPSIFDDADGRYIGYDDVIRPVPEGHHHIYANYSGWDIYRSEWPLLTLIEPARAQDMAQSIVEMYKQEGFIDRWPEANRPTAVMNGNPLTICLANIWNAGLRNFDMGKAYEGMMKSSVPTSTNAHLGPYEQIEDHGGVWLNADSNVSTALEYDVSFAALGRLALALNKPDDANFLFGRALEYHALFNPETGFFQARNGLGEWVNPDVNTNYCEGNKWIYLWFVPEDIQGLVGLLGGSDAFEKKLDEFFSGNHYDATNEPDLQAPFLYDYINHPWKTQKLVADTADIAFTDSPGGLANGGNDDLGTMSAWYILTQLGFYPVDPGIPAFEVCTPRFPKAILHLGSQPGASVFTIAAPGASPGNVYIQSATLNGQPLTKPWFYEKEILSGGEWNVLVGAQPNTDWGSSPLDRPWSLSTGLDYLPPAIVTVPLIPPAAGAPLAWRYTTTFPGKDWNKPVFPDNAWKQAPGGFGTEDVGVNPRTPWNTDDIWMRTTLDLNNLPPRLGVSVYHDQDAEVYLNGVLIVQDQGFVHEYRLFPVQADARATLHTGRNILAMHVHHPGAGRHFADAALVEERLPK
jgi:predicted alpha-1,2-mannosidase